MTRFLRTAILGALAAVIALVMTACGSDTDDASNGDATGAPPGPTNPSTSVPVVAGPSHAPPTQEPDTEETEDDANCGRIGGPDGSLQVSVLDGDIDCTEAMDLARQYGPLIATGEDQSVGGWDCGPSSDPGVMATCESGDRTIGFVIP